MSALDHLKEYRVVKVVLPLQEGGQQLIDGVAKTTTPPVFEVTFLPEQLIRKSWPLRIRVRFRLTWRERPVRFGR